MKPALKPAMAALLDRYDDELAVTLARAVEAQGNAWLADTRSEQEDWEMEANRLTVRALAIRRRQLDEGGSDAAGEL